MNFTEEKRNGVYTSNKKRILRKNIFVVRFLTTKILEFPSKGLDDEMLR